LSLFEALLLFDDALFSLRVCSAAAGPAVGPATWFPVSFNMKLGVDEPKCETSGNDTIPTKPAPDSPDRQVMSKQAAGSL
jgi:hypothetical protein